MKKFILVSCLMLGYMASHAQIGPAITNQSQYTDQTAQTKIDSIYRRLLVGENFDSLAVTVSQDPGSSANGGRLGWQKPDIYVPEFRDILNNLTINEVSKPFRTAFGYHIVQLLARKGDTVLARHILLRVEP